MNEENIIQLEKQVLELTSWKESRSRERLRLPLDSQSRKAINYWNTPNFSGLPVFTGKVFPSFIDLLTDFLAVGIEVSINGQFRYVLLTFNLRVFTANAGTDVLTDYLGNHNMENGSIVALTTTSSLPGGLDTITQYYVVNKTASTFQLSLSKGGSPVDITDSGTGTQYYAVE